ncbi:hypothetical protein [Flavobacterium chungangense]|uniref:Lipoprotein n=1 Tax=Flavobacterium chungangense TaxID=554283 RepID=A0A6V6ZG99_9FLAO|nr:hypothetical protein [Flavobacterium chungangense]CAD0009972.1 hypothetical protein FLACHUCJ7_04612 [Flavobacterium chungangense]
MKKFYIILAISIFLTSCQRKVSEEGKVAQREFSADSLKKYNFKLLHTDYEFEFSNRQFKIDFYKFSDTIKLSNVEENEIARIFFENYIDTLKGDNFVSEAEKPVIMPSFGDSFYIYQNGAKKSFFRILNGEYKSLDNLNQHEKNILFFRNDLMSVLKKNPDFKRCVDTLKAVKKYDKRLFL